jgi:aryl-alcohol dehydrogenase-like predicted oxidoreductase
VIESYAEPVCQLVAIAYVLHKTPYVFPIIGGRKVEHLKQNVQALDISLSTEQIQRIDNAKPFEYGFPFNVIVRTS